MQEEESLGPTYNLASLREARASLLRLIHREVGLSQTYRHDVYRRFWELARETTLNIGVVTTNYDTLLDEAFDFLYPHHAFIDYCIPFMNYEWNATPIAMPDAFDWWVDPRQPVPIWKEGAAPVPIKVIKIHGSLNWHDCPACGQVLLRPFSRFVPGADKSEADIRIATPFCPWDGERFRPFIVPPSHTRTLRSPMLAQLRGEAAREIRSARQVVVVGYSFPPPDVHLKALLTKNLMPDCTLTVIDPCITDRMRAAFQSLNRPVEFVNGTFQDAIANPDILRRLLVNVPA